MKKFREQNLEQLVQKMSDREIKVMIGYAKLMKLLYVLEVDYDMAHYWLHIEQKYQRKLKCR